MNKINFVFAAIVAGAFVASAAEEAAKDAPKKKMSKEQVQELVYNYTGGKLKVPGVQKGKIVFVNAQKAVPDAWFNEVIRYFDPVQVEIELAHGEFSLENPKIEGNATLYAIDDPKLPSVLHAPDSRWTMVNFARLREGNGEKPAFFELRCKKQLVRGFALLAGAQKSSYPDSLLLPMVKIEDYDKYPDYKIPVDLKPRYGEYLKALGVVPYKLASYRHACQAGWAPAPTNGVQKKIWDKIHALPTEPIKIKPEAKKVAE